MWPFERLKGRARYSVVEYMRDDAKVLLQIRWVMKLPPKSRSKIGVYDALE